MFKWFRLLKLKDREADALLEQAHQTNLEAIKTAKTRSRNTARQADKQLKKVYDVAEKIYIATGHR